MRGFIPPQNQEETVFCKKAMSLCEKADSMGIKSFTSFMDLRQKELFLSQCHKYKNLEIAFFYGYEGEGERAIACVYPSYETIEEYEVPLCVLVSEIKDETSLTHRDFLGALMNLMIKREYIGDILIDEKKVYIICHTNISQIIKQELTCVKRSNLQFDFFDDTSLVYQKASQEKKTATVASLRLDAVLAAILKTSRSQALGQLRQGLISVNHLVTKHADFEIITNDVISIRGTGKYKVFCDGNKSKKDRIFIDYIKY